MSDIFIKNREEQYTIFTIYSFIRYAPPPPPPNQKDFAHMAQSLQREQLQPRSDTMGRGVDVSSIPLEILGKKTFPIKL